MATSSKVEVVSCERAIIRPCLRAALAVATCREEAAVETEPVETAAAAAAAAAAAEVAVVRWWW